MSELTFSQAERRSFLVPALIALAVLALAFGGVYLYMPHRVADLSVTHMAILPTHTVFHTDTKLVGAQPDAQDVVYVLATVRIDDRLHVPLFISDFTGTMTTADGAEVTGTALQKGDLDNVYITFPALKPLATAPLVRESTIQPGDHAEGMVLLNFPVSEADWKNRQSASIAVEFYHQGQFTVDIPKDQGTGNSK